MIVPAWVNPNQGVPLNPPAIVLKLGAMPRTPENLVAVPRAVFITTAKRYAPVIIGGQIVSTWCNVAVSDLTTILRAPISHVLDGKELNANATVDALRAGRFAGWATIGTLQTPGAEEMRRQLGIPQIGTDVDAIVARAAAGLPTVGVWKNPAKRLDSQKRVILGADGKPLYHSGHVVLVVPTPAGHSGIYVSGAGAQCLDQCPIARAFGGLVSQVEFFGHE